MNKQQLLTIYPKGNFQNNPISDDSYLNLPLETEWFCIPLEELSNSEIELLKTLYPDSDDKHFLDHHLWYHYLFQNKPLPSSDRSYRVIQLKLKKKSIHSKEWLTHLSKLFNHVEDYFFIDQLTALVIEEKTAIISQKEELEGMLLTLENDFLIQANAYIGSFNESSHNFTAFFEEESSLFISYYQEKRKVFSFQDIALDYLTKDKIIASPVMQSLKESLNLDEEIKQIIKTLWLKQGNLTSTSKELYIHRNTLQYRLDKFYERFGLSLKNMKELTLCYLLIH